MFNLVTKPDIMSDGPLQLSPALESYMWVMFIYVVHLNMCDGMLGGASQREHAWNLGTLETPCLGFGHRLVSMIWSWDRGMWWLGAPSEPLAHPASVFRWGN